ncbi:MAG: glycosyltransferase family 4 protein [Candidatus Aenigmatarchaeota archaeon]
MKIAIIAFTGVYPIHIGGPGSVAYFVSKWLGEFGHDITLFVRVKTQEEHKRIEEIDEFKRLRNVHVVPAILGDSFRIYANLPYLGYKILAITKRFSCERFEVVHYNSPPSVTTFLFPLIAKLKQSKQTLAIHGGIFYEYKIPISKLIVKMGRNWFKKVIVLNDFSRDLTKKALGFKEEKIVVIPNGVELEAIDKVKPLNLLGEPKILYVGRLVKIKGVDVLLQSFSVFIRKFPQAILYIVGDGPLRSSLEKLAEKLGIREKVVFKGFIPPPFVWRYYKSVDVVVLPSYMENFSITLLEAMASKVPIIASDAPGNVSILKDGENGLLFPRGNWEELNTRMINIISDNNLRRRIIANGYQLVRDRYDWKKIAVKYHETFQSLLTKS